MTPYCHPEPLAEFILERSEGLKGKLREESAVAIDTYSVVTVH